MESFFIGIVVIFVLIVCLGITWIRKLLRENKTKEIAIIGLKEVIRLLEQQLK